MKPGTKVGPYEILALIGAGGMGEVYRARDTRLGRDVAVKVLPAEASEKAERVRRFAQEARAAGALNHPNILSVYDVGEQDGAPYLVTELLEGESLRERLAEGTLPVRKAVAIAARIAEGLAAAHEKGIVHRDLKPGNIFLTKDGRVKILDFGLARLLQDAWGSGSDSKAPTAEPGTRPGLIVGTMGYMSPEQVKGKPADARSDLFALGVMLYEMLSGKRPFTGDSDAEIMTAILKDDPPPLDAEKLSLPPLIERTVAHCLEKNPARRFQSAQDIVFALDTVTSASGISKALPPLPEETRRRRLKWMAAALALALAGAGLASAGLLWGRYEYLHPLPSHDQLTFRRGIITSARFSPDGNTVYYSAAWNGKPQEVFAKRLDTVESQAMGLAKMQVVSVASGEMAVFLDVSTNPWVASSHTLARVPLSGGKPRRILQDVKSADYAPGTTSLAVSHLINQTCRIEYPIGKVIYESKGEITNLRFSPDRAKLAFVENVVQNAAIVTGRVVCLDLESGDKRTLTPLWGSVRGIAWGHGGKEVWIAAKKQGKEFSLYAVSLSGHVRTISRSLEPIMLCDMGPGNRVLLSREDKRRESRGLLAGMNQEGDLSWLDATYAWEVSEDGRTLIFGEVGMGGGPRNAIYMLKTDGSPPVRMGEGDVGSLSSDGRWLVIGGPRGSNPLQLIPTGAGQAVDLPAGTAKYRQGVGWFPKSMRIRFMAAEEGRLWRIWVQDVPDGLPRPITPEGYSSWYGPVSPDEKYFAAFPWDIVDAKKIYSEFPIDGGEPVPIPGIKEGEHPVQYSAGGRYLYVLERSEAPAAPVCKLDLKTGRRERWRVLCPPDLAGVVAIVRISISYNGRYYAYCYERVHSKLLIVNGLS